MMRVHVAGLDPGGVKARKVPVRQKQGREAVQAIEAALVPGGVRWWDP